jgi:hypothetical protein
MKTLIFVYNAKSDLLNSAFDFAHKILHPSSYSCSLCKLTHGNLREKTEWKEFKKSHSIEFVFYHIDEFEEVYPSYFSYPVVFEQQGEELMELVSTEVLNKIESTQELINLLNKELTK